jgi:hypothetical protein
MQLRKWFVLLIFILFSFSIYAQNGSEIFLFDISRTGEKVVLINPENITKRIGYDNQPFFHPKKPIVYFTSMENGQTDIWEYNYKSMTKRQITFTEDSEYSPTVIPGTYTISCIVQRKANGDQDLVKIDLTNPKQTEILLLSQKTGKVGYQAWLNEDKLVTFILGSPQSLHFHDLSKKEDQVIVQNISRSLHLIPKTKVFSFVQELDKKWLIRNFDPNSGTIETITKSDPNSEHYNAWMNKNKIFESRNSDIFAYDLNINLWSKVALPVGFNSKKISRMAIKGNKIAVVMDE